MFSLICDWINGWVNNGEGGDLRRHRAHYDVSVMRSPIINTWHAPSKNVLAWSHKQVPFCMKSFHELRIKQQRIAGLATYLMDFNRHNPPPPCSRTLNKCDEIALIYFVDQWWHRYQIPTALLWNAPCRAIECQMRRWMIVLLPILSLFSCRCITHHAIGVVAIWDMHPETEIVHKAR